MIFEVYAKGQKGLNKDKGGILTCVGKDYLEYYGGSRYQDEKWCA